MRGLLLLSGGIDSPVAGYLLRKKMDIIAVHFSQEPFTNKMPEEKCEKLAKQLGIKLIVKNLGEELENISKKCDHRYYFILMKRLLLREAEKIAKKEKCDYLITGEALAQVSSQTLDSLVAIDCAVKMPVLRPLIGFNKQEIIDVAIEIGTFDISKGPEMCDVLGPKHPTTAPDLKAVLEEEKKL